MAAAMVALESADIVRDAMSPDLSPLAQQRWLDDAADCFRRNGVVVIRNAIPPAAIAALLANFRVRHDVHMAPGQKKLFRTFQTDPLRAQIPTTLDGPVADPAVFAPPSVLALARRLMGDDIIVGELGVVISHPGAGPQETHRDSTSLFGGLGVETEFPPVSMTMLAPLVDVGPGMGPTEYWPGTHRLQDDAVDTTAPPLRATLNAGSVVMHDWRIYHRGGANTTGPVRPALYVCFQRKWFLSISGYEYKPQVRVTPQMLLRLPETYRPLFSWALHLNRTDGVSEFVYRWTGRIRKRLLALKGS